MMRDEYAGSDKRCTRLCNESRGRTYDEISGGSFKNKFDSASVRLPIML